MEIQQIQLKIGDYEIIPVPTGLFGLDGGSMFGTVPKVLWQKSNPADEQNRIQMEARALLLRGNNRLILIDTGNGGDFIAKYGDKLGSKFAQMYAVSGNGLIQSLARHRVTPDMVTDVILTHLHFDHAGGATCEKNGELVPTFSKAMYYVQKANLETARKPNIREKASYFAANFEPLEKAGVLKLVEGNQQNLLPGISVEVSNGHTQGHQFVKVSDGAKTLVYCGDVIPTSSHVRLAWIMGYDLEPLKIIEEKRQILEKAAQQGWYLYFEHDPQVDAAQVSQQGQDFTLSHCFQIASS